MLDIQVTTMHEEKALPESARHAKNSRAFRVFRASLKGRPQGRTPWMKEVPPLKNQKIKKSRLGLKTVERQ